jgi:hypothetical protein
LADTLAFSHHDTDDYFWRPTIPPYQEKRGIADRLRLMHEMFLERADWVLSGSLEGWGDPIAAHFDLVVFLHTAKEIRLQRLRAREARHFGADAVAPGLAASGDRRVHRMGIALRCRRPRGTHVRETSGMACEVALPRAAS